MPTAVSDGILTAVRQAVARPEAEGVRPQLGDVTRHARAALEGRPMFPCDPGLSTIRTTSSGSRKMRRIDENTMNIEIDEYNEYKQGVAPMLLNACSSPAVGNESILCSRRAFNRWEFIQP